MGIPDGIAALVPMAVTAIAQWLAWLSLVGAQRPICQMSDAFAASVDMHIKDWDSQIDFALNESLNCSDFLEYVYLSRDRIRAQLDYVAELCAEVFFFAFLHLSTFQESTVTISVFSDSPPEICRIHREYYIDHEMHLGPKQPSF